jgi:tetraacyldisaccharide 4'-kinase
VPVISVGNIGVGGRGKTPAVAEIARLLIAAGERPAILSRGYARRIREDGVVVVSDGRHLLSDVERSGDEPMMLARAVPDAAVFVCEQRRLAGVLAERIFHCTVLILDDGFQHREMARDVDIVIVTHGDLTDRVMPFGRLRQPVGALGAADAIVIDEGFDADSGRRPEFGRRDVLPDVLPPSLRDKPAFTLRRSTGTLQPLEPDRPWPSSPVPLLAVAAIAEPDRFRLSLESLGWPIADFVAYRDHHWFTPRDLDRLADRAARAGAVAAVTTTKDAMRLLVHRPLPIPFAHLPLEVRLEPAAVFGPWLLSRLAEARA